MEYVRFGEANEERPADGWRRAGLVSKEAVSVDWFEKPPGHVSDRHSHENEQVFVVLDGEFVLYTDGESVTLGRYDTAWVDAGEPHWSENPGTEPTVGLNVFAPGRRFPYWSR
ncbi:cupin domain-containing protein [Halalkalicoccus sp. NIPERK01]|uniref:cupin domain-containing protein n=1 Tax=Halalkalicoccus sp. NIPERK01 TaxID=3053469 RepID=UPI00256EC76E|nr:cupin domain-containing protein [Halalkalicoccus sp. NIPERK01]MDL5362922.1 cupin domain-containing protein [Halalkalicoccus sp. NIPERK01]